MRIKKILIEGFRSIRKVEFAFDDKGVHVVQGQNGAGKSTLFEALYYGLYGDSIKNTPVAELLTLKRYRGVGYKGLRVELDFNINDTDYKVIRSIDYGESKISDVEFFKNGERVGTDNKTDAQVKISAAIGITPTLFKNSVFFAQKSVRLVDSKDADRREVFDELFDISLDLAQQKAKQAHDAVKTELVVATSEVQKCKDNITYYLNKYDSDKLLLDTFNTTQTEKILNINKQIQTLKDSLLNRPSDLIEVLPVEAPDERKLFEIKLKEQRIASNLESAQYRYNQITGVSDVCKSCGGKLSDAKVKELIAQQDTDKKALEVEMDQLSKDLAQVRIDKSMEESDITKQRKNYQEYQDYCTTQAVELKAVDKLKHDIKSYEMLLQEVKSQTNNVTEETLKDIEIAISAWRKRESELIAKCGDLKVKEIDYLYWATDGFSNKGLKAHIINAMLVKLNAALQVYGTELGILVSFNVKMDTKTKGFNITITDVNGVEKSYGSLSGGEQKRVDIIVSFALHDIISTKVSLLVMDEIFEGLDEAGQDIAMSLIRNKSMEQAVYLISHNINLDLSQANIIVVGKNDNETVINN